MKPTQEQVIAWAREAGGWKQWEARVMTPQVLEHFAALAYEAGRAALAQPEQEIESDRPHAEDDGCPTEKAVLQRFWREHQKQEPVRLQCVTCGTIYADGVPPQVVQPEQEPVATLFGSLPVYDVPTKQEPVAWMHNFIDEVVIAHRPVDLDRHPDRWTALYKNPTPCQTCEALARTVMMDQTSHDNPPQREWQGLTDEEYESMAENHVTDYFFDTLKYARAIEAKLKEKNT